jgi:hypothetical protein
MRHRKNAKMKMTIVGLLIIIAMPSPLLGQNPDEALTPSQRDEIVLEVNLRRALRAKLGSFMVSEVNFKDAMLEDIAVFIRSKSTELDPVKKGVNVLVTPGAMEAAKDKTVTLSLRQVPLDVVMRYAIQMLDLSWHVDTHAIVIDAPKKAEKTQ